VRVPLLRADGDENIRWITPQPERKRVADSAPPRSTFDWTALCRPGYRTVQMMRDAANALTLDAAGDPVEAARREKIARLSDAWQDPDINYRVPQSSQEAGGGQSSNGDDEALEGEQERANATQGEIYRDAYKKRVSDMWQNPPGMRTDARVADTARPFMAPVADRRGTPILDRPASVDRAALVDRESAYAAVYAALLHFGLETASPKTSRYHAQATTAAANPEGTPMACASRSG
jgi:hypothetical protein